MKDAILLLICALIASALAWAFFHFSGVHAFAVLQSLLVVGLLLDNHRLRKQLKTKR